MPNPNDRVIHLTLAEARRLHDAFWINALGEGEFAEGDDLEILRALADQIQAEESALDGYARDRET